jgi:hypothetical protein
MRSDREIRHIAHELDVAVRKEAHGLAVTVSRSDDALGVRQITYKGKDGRRLERDVLDGIREQLL